MSPLGIILLIVLVLLVLGVLPACFRLFARKGENTRMKYWIFKCNPEWYKLSERLADKNPKTSWRVTSYEKDIAPDDIVFLMETGPNRRIRAIIAVDTAPQVIPELPHEKEFCTGIDTSVRCRILGTFKRQDVDLPVKDLRGIEALRGLSLFHGDQRGTNFPVTQKEGEVIMALTER